MIKFTEPGRQAGSLPVERVIQLGRKTVKGYPEKLTGMLVSFTHQDMSDAAGNRQVDHELMAVLLRRQAEIDPSQPTDLLRVMEVFLPPSDDLSGVFDGDFMCRTDQGEIVCRGDGESATWVHGWHSEDDRDGKEVAVWDPLPPFLRPVDPQQVCVHGGTRVACAGRRCPMFERARADGKPAFPRCKAEWMLRVQIAVRHATFGTARLRSTSIIGYDETLGVLKQLQKMQRQGRIPGLSVVPLRLTLKNTRTKHAGKQGVWTVFLDHPGGAISMMLAAENTAREQRYLGVERQAEPVIAEESVAFEDVVDVDDVEPECADEPSGKSGSLASAKAMDVSPSPDPSPSPALSETEPPTVMQPNDVSASSNEGTLERVKGLALSLCEGNATRAKELMATVRDALREDDQSFPTPRPNWGATAEQVALYEDALRAFASEEEE